MSNYTQSNYERDLAIRDNAPEGATHYDFCYYTFSETVENERGMILHQWREWKDHKSTFVKTTIAGLRDLRSLSDIETSIAQYETIEKLKAELGEIRATYADLVADLSKELTE
jgi:hypothetical protein